MYSWEDDVCDSSGLADRGQARLPLAQVTEAKVLLSHRKGCQVCLRGLASTQKGRQREAESVHFAQ